MKPLRTYWMRWIMPICWFCSFQLTAQNISKIEYFVDTDPGFGKATPFTVNAGQDVTTQFSVSLNALSTGFHTLGIRSWIKPYRSSNDSLSTTKGGWSITQTKFFYKEAFVTSQTPLAAITKGEYFIDADPGFGKGVSLAFTPATALPTQSFAFDLTNLSTGFHRLYVRFRNAKGEWSSTQQRLFYKENISISSIPLAAISSGEYFVDEDPGFGKGNRIQINAGTNVTANSIIIDITKLANGFHSLYSRFKDKNGEWSITQTKIFYKESVPNQTSVLPNLVKGEYFIDKDPGFGKGTHIAVKGASDSSSSVFFADMNSFSTGFHHLYARFIDAKGQWSSTVHRTFYKDTISTQQTSPLKIIGGEYFMDADPGFGKGKKIVLNSGIDQTASFQADISDLTDGFHQLYIRLKDEKGHWTLTSTRAFYKQPPITTASLPKIIQAEYFVDKDPGFGKGRQIAVTPQTTVDPLVFEVDQQTLTLGDHNLSVRVKNEKGQWSLTHQSTFRIETPTGTFVTMGSIQKLLCISNQVTIPFTVNSPFSESNVFTAQLSDADGSFASPQAIGTLSGTGSGTITGTVPYVTPGTNYRIRIISSNPARISAANNSPLSIHRIPSVFSIEGDTIACLGLKNYALRNFESGTGLYQWTLSSGGTLQTNGTDASVQWSAAGTYTLKVNYTGVCAGADSVKTLSVRVVDQPLTGSFQNLLPQDKETALALPIRFTWSPISGAVTYDLYIWPINTTRPVVPTIQDITAINYTLSNLNLIQYDQTYQWQLVAKRDCQHLDGPIRTFTTRRLPDLIVESISTPTTAVSETEMVVNWVVKNQGEGETDASWHDLVYLCDQPDLATSSEKFLIGDVLNFSALNAGQSYRSANLSYKIPQGVQGNYYIIVRTNYINSFKEASTANNEKISSVLKITLAPPPDLQVTAITVAPLTAFSGDEVTVTYTVTNKGTGPTTVSSWSDQLLISNDKMVQLATDQVLDTYQNSGLLAVNGSYQVVRKVNLPARLSGLYYIHAQTDRYNQVFEYNKEDNNGLASLPLTIIQKPTPNLVISEVSLSAKSLSNGQSLTVDWTTTNDGSLAAPPSWIEGVYLSTNETFDAREDLLIGEFVRRDSLFSLSSSRMQGNLKLPLTLKEGDYYLFVVTDIYHNVYENPSETDNVSIPYKISLANPDLQPISFSVPATAFSGETVTLQWKVKNDSPGAIYNSTWLDRIFLSRDQTYDGTDLFLTETSSDQFLPPNGEYTQSASVTLPNQISGEYYLILVSNATKAFTERSETNNVSNAAIRMNLSPWPDLEVSTIDIPVTDTVGTSITVQYTIKNSGTASLINKNWLDAIYLSPTSTLDASTQVLLGTSYQSRSVIAGQSYSQTSIFTIPGTLPPGAYYVVVKTDADQVIFENNAKTNNIKGSVKTVNCIALPQTDLSVVTGQILSSTITAGQSINLQWTVKNNSTTPTSIPFWTDAVYLSTNPVWDANDPLLGSTFITSSLNPGSSYTKNMTVAIPQEVSGTIFLIVVTDRSNQLYDPNRLNNSLAMTVDGGGTSIPVVTPPPADLVPAFVSVPTQAVASQPITLIVKVKNAGTGATPSSNWLDQCYLSTDGQISNSTVLGSIYHMGTLNAGGEYIDTLQLTMPANLTGNYYLVFKTDANNYVFERNNETNNDIRKTLFISPQQPCDLVVTTITLPVNEQYAGENTVIRWTLANKGKNSTQGFLREAVYVSSDTVWSATDVLLGTLESNIDLSAQASTIHTLEKPLANLPTGQYYIIVKTDILNNIVEQNETNNQAVSNNTFAVAVKELLLNTLTAATLPATGPLYYRIEIPASLAGETLALVLKGDSTQGAINRLFIRQGSMPTVNQYNYSGATPFQANQDLVVPSLGAGTYYVLVVGGNSTIQNQPVSLFARIIPFGIKTVNANQGGNTGLATLKITGARFDSHTSFRLKKNGSEAIQAYRIQYIDQTLVYVTFNLLNKSLGSYDVEAVQAGGNTTVLPKSFTITQGTGNLFTSTNAGTTVGSGFVCTITNVGFEDQFETELVTPANVRFAAVTSFIVSYQNNGSVDIPIPTKYLLSLNENNPVAFSVDQLKSNKSDLVLECKEEGGPPGILRPGAKGFFKVYTVSNNRTIPSIDIVITD